MATRGIPGPFYTSHAVHDFLFLLCASTSFGLNPFRPLYILPKAYPTPKKFQLTFAQYSSSLAAYDAQVQPVATYVTFSFDPQRTAAVVLVDGLHSTLIWSKPWTVKRILFDRFLVVEAKTRSNYLGEYVAHLLGAVITTEVRFSDWVQEHTQSVSLNEILQPFPSSALRLYQRK